MVDTLCVLRNEDHVYHGHAQVFKKQARTLPVAYDRRTVIGTRSKEGEKRRTRMRTRMTTRRQF